MTGYERTMREMGVVPGCNYAVMNPREGLSHHSDPLTDCELCGRPTINVIDWEGERLYCCASCSDAVLMRRQAGTALRVSILMYVTAVLRAIISWILRRSP